MNKILPNSNFSRGPEHNQDDINRAVIINRIDLVYKLIQETLAHRPAPRIEAIPPVKTVERPAPVMVATEKRPVEQSDKPAFESQEAMAADARDQIKEIGNASTEPTDRPNQEN